MQSWKTKSHTGNQSERETERENFAIDSLKLYKKNNLHLDTFEIHGPSRECPKAFA